MFNNFLQANNLHQNSDPDTSYTEILYAHLLDSDGSRLTYTHFTTKVNVGTLVEITFNRPVYIQKHKVCFFLLLCIENERILFFFIKNIAIFFQNRFIAWV